MQSDKSQRGDEGWIETYTGQRLCPLAPDPMLVSIDDIAHGLAGRFRFAGQSRQWYTVAQHSFEVSCRVPRADALWGLLHDAAEAYLPDVARPIKAKVYVLAPACSRRAPCDRSPSRCEHLVPFKAAEEQLLAAIAMRFGLALPIPASVHEADGRELARERRDLFDATRPTWPGLGEPYPEPLDPLVPAFAEALFLNRFAELRP